MYTAHTVAAWKGSLLEKIMGIFLEAVVRFAVIKGSWTHACDLVRGIRRLLWLLPVLRGVTRAQLGHIRLYSQCLCSPS